MRKTSLILAALLVCGVAVVWATQNETVSIRDVRNPVSLRSIINDNASDAEDRFIILESATSVAATVSGNLTVTSNLTVTLDATITGSDLTIGAAGVKLTGDGDGALTFLGLGNGSDEDLTLNLDDTANTAVFSSSTGVDAWTLTGMGLTVGLDLTVSGGDIDSGAGAMTIGKAAATSLALGAADINTSVLGPLTVLGGTGKGIDTTAAGALYLGQATATSVVIGASDADTTITGDLTVTGLDIDSGAGAMTIGKAAATSLTLGASDITTSVAGPLTNPRFTATTSTTNALTLTSAHYGTMVMINTNAAVAVTLPANGAASGSWIDIAVYSAATDDCIPTISAATEDTLITPGSSDSDSVTWATGHRIGAYARFWSDGAFWHVSNLGGTTMTYTDSD